jgi:cation diffusion facilitator CzcD-associated flavoprotein CzcO
MDTNQNNKNLIVDVAIIGAGASGLACGLKLVQSNPEMRLAILEARDRVGGRTLSDTTYVATDIP